MNTLPYPGGAARAIAEARARGLKPAEIVLIDLGGTSDWPNPTVYADPFKRYRWDWLMGLNVVILIKADTRMGSILDDIERAEPSQVDVLDTERRIGWLINATAPTLKTVKWPPAWVSDWLGEGTLFADLKRIKDEAAKREKLTLHGKQLRQQQDNEYDLLLEKIWN